MSIQTKKLPELLCPAGSPEALDAAIEGGADAVYLGGAHFNARMHAKNFGGDALRSAVLRAHRFGVKVYLTLNTLVTDRELGAFVEAAAEAARAGVDALIVADAGGAAAIHRALPSLELHASTQMSGHTVAMGEELQKMGFSRMVIARETSEQDIRTIVEHSPIETELFIHGALCVSHSGQCLFSSLVGGRSGNRGECAQPCRLPFCGAACTSKKEAYPLSLKDLSLARHVPALIEMGVASLKIEGRMKSPEYVRDTARIWRRLLDERRGATDEEMRTLADVFSRSGLTDGYYRERIHSSMLGIRSDADKSISRTLEPFSGLSRRIPLSLSLRMRREEPISLSVSDGIKAVTVCGDLPQAAINAPLTRESVDRSLSKMGGTVYTVSHFEADMDEGLMLPISRLNDLRRRALQALEEQDSPTAVDDTPVRYSPATPTANKRVLRTARFQTAAQIPSVARSYFDRIYLPLFGHEKGVAGVVMPPVIFDRDVDKVRARLRQAVENGATHALLGNYGHLSLVLEAGLAPEGDYRLNVTNRESVAVAEAHEISSILLSPELTLPQIRDIGGDTGAIVYGRIPLMTLEKCVIREIADCKTCDRQPFVLLKDRRGVEFPVVREWEHRNVILNSLPTGMSDREEALRRAGITNRHFLFSVEDRKTVEAVISAYEKQAPLPCTVRRM